MSSDDQAFIDALNQAESAEPQQAEAPQAATETPDPAPQSATPAEQPSYIDLDDKQVVRYKIGGQEYTRPWGEVKQTQILLPGDYTRKMQAIAAERREFEALRSQKQQEWEQYQAEKQALAQALQDPAKIEAWYLAVMAQRQAQAQGQVGQPNPQAQPAQPPFDPAQLQGYVQQSIAQQLQAYAAQQQQAQVNSERANVLERHVESILNVNPALKALPGVNEYLYGQVYQMVVPGQTTMAEAQQYLDHVAQGIAANLNQHYTQATKQQVVAQSQLKNGIEPPGGSPNLPTAKQYNRKLGLEDPEMEADVLAFVKAQLGG